MRSPTSRARQTIWSGPAGRRPGSTRTCRNGWTAIGRLTDENAEAAELLAENQAAYTASAEKLSVDERASGAEYEQIRDEIRGRRRPPAAGQGPSGRRPAQRQSQAHDKFVGAERDLSHGRTALAAALAELIAQAAAFEPYTQGDLRPLLEVTRDRAVARGGTVA